VKQIAILLVLAACGAPAAQQQDSLQESIISYNEGMRWERFETAAAALPPKERPQAVDDWDERAKDLKITQYDIVKIDNKGTREARVHLKLAWYKTSEGTLRETHEIQTWERHGKDWVLVDEKRLRGAEMPGLPDPVDGPKKHQEKDRDP
jgi:hypothetical protein